MSEFQKSLLVIALLVVVAVYAYGYWQQWRYRRSLDRGDAEPRPAPRAVVSEPAAEFTAKPAEEADHHFISDKPVAEACDLLDDKLDYIVSMIPKFPVSADALEAFWPRRFDYGKTIQTCGCNAATGAWERVIPESPANYSELKIALQLVDRNGVISDTRLADFRELLGEIGRKQDADMVLPLTDTALERARELDTFCASVDQMIGLNLISRGERPLFASEVARAVQQSGMSLQADGTFHQFAEDGATLYTLAVSDGMPFQHHTLDQMQVKSLTLLLDIPRVHEPVKCFDDMILLALDIAPALRVTLVDDQRVILSQGAITHIRDSVDAVEQRMLAGGLVPGSAQALRLFS
ncbi:MAG: cell division protein ZipA C-terminal FtsZ-binding domain-containing protein [Gammaproteobacteria bacterium]|nr:cell division protein ZipA C-terminal FtsZ-binding domain-containing protein [Gammaproteobacteria bacterium]MBU1623704.1 cell division protein ZipA C-terminal FtsZ-binding domain-containing protein [Gammaproteobacteria bacterium]